MPRDAVLGVKYLSLGKHALSVHKVYKKELLISVFMPFICKIASIWDDCMETYVTSCE
jgi:hypothetical protein